MSVNTFNQCAFQEVKNTYYQTCSAGTLSNRDLLVLVLEPIIRDRALSVTVDDILQNGLRSLAKLTELELSMTYGLTEKQSFHLMAVFELAKRLLRADIGEKAIIRSPEDVPPLVYDLCFLDKEHFVVLFLNTKNAVIGRATISIGTLNAALVHPREVFKTAIQRSAASIIAVHNHPSGETTASQEDVELTKRLVEVGNLVGIDLLDHIIVGANSRYFSLKESGYM